MGANWKFYSFTLCLSMLMMIGGSNNDFDYDKAWTEVNKQLNKQLPKSALKQVQKIYAQALDDKNTYQQVKATIFEANLILNTEELGLELAIKNLDDKIDQAAFPAKSILQSQAAELVQSYFRRNHWTISQRTDLEEFDTGDIRTWTTNNYRDYVSGLYFQSIDDQKLRGVDTKEVKDLLQSHSSTLIDYNLRPNLYDLLVDRVLNYLRAGNDLGTRPSFKFRVENKYLVSAEDFIKLELTSKDSISTDFKRLKLYQDILAYHLSQENYKALRSYDIERADYLISQLRDKKLAKRFNLEAETFYNQHDLGDIFGFRYAQQLSGEAEYKKAITKCKVLIERNQEHVVVAQSKNLIAQIESIDLQLKVEDIYTSVDSIKVQINSKNLEESFISIFDISKMDIDEYQRNNQNLVENIIDLKPMMTTTVGGLKKDYRFHSKVLTYDPLPYGKYAIAVSNTENLKDGQNIIKMGMITVSDLGLTVMSNIEKPYILLRNRITGEPVKDVELQYYKQEYDRSARRYRDKKLNKAKTDMDGKSFLSDKNRNLILAHEKGKDQYAPRTNVYGNRINDYLPDGNIEIFTDRAIYRPGQIVEFKGIAIGYDAYKIPHIAPKSNGTVYLMDANYQKVGELEITTNEYGSFSGSFTIPEGRLTGNYTLEASLENDDFIDEDDDNEYYGSGRKSFKVEEYKRPTFQVKLDTMKAEYRLGDLVAVSGVAISYAGVPIANSKLTYKVEQGYRYFGWSRWYGQNNNKTQVAQAEIETDDQGLFSFEFLAQAPVNMNVQGNPMLHYSINVDVTNANGETRSANESILISKLPYAYKLDLEKVVDVNDLKEIKIEAINAKQVAVKSDAVLTVVKLQEPNEWQRSDYWSKQGVPSYWYRGGNSQASTDADLSQYPELEEILKTKLLLSPDKKIFAILSELSSGSYKISLKSTENYEGDHVEEIKYIAVNNARKDDYRPLRLLHKTESQSSYRVGEQLNVKLNATAEKVDIYYQWMNGHREVEAGWITVSQSESLQHKVRAQDQGGISLHLNYIYQNRLFQDRIDFNIPWDDKQLQVKLTSFRDLIVPGTDESWTLQVIDHEGKPYQGELLATMYDESLDQFVQHRFGWSPYPSHYSSLSSGTSHFGLGSVLSNHRYRVPRESFSYPVPARIIGFNQFLYQNGYLGDIRIRGSRSNATDYYIDGVRAVGQVQKRSKSMPAPEMSMDNVDSGTIDEVVVMASATNVEVSTSPQQDKENDTDIAIRENLNETVFFYPELKPDRDGNIKVDFKMNDALTTWKFQAVAHDQQLRYGFATQTVKTQKDVMILPKPPRFLRCRDEIKFPATVSNLSDQDFEAKAKLQILDVFSGEDVSDQFGLQEKYIKIDVAKSASEKVAWTIQVPEAYTGVIKYVVTVEANDHTDGQSDILPILTDQIMVTEAKVLYVKGGETKQFDLGSYNRDSNTANPYQFSLEYSSSPVWYAVQALPYLHKSPHPTASSLQHRIYANMLAQRISKANPKIKEVYERWTAENSAALKSNLEKNIELKSALLEETPWVRTAQGETQQKKDISILFDNERMKAELQVDIQQLTDIQLPSGGFPWIKGGRENISITQQVIESLERLISLDALDESNYQIQNMLNRAYQYADEQLIKRYETVLKYHPNAWTDDIDHLDYLSIQYLYLRSFRSQEIPVKAQKAYSFYGKESQEHWNIKNLYAQAMMGLYFYRNDDATYEEIKASLVERSFYRDDLGRYWNLGNGYHWQDLPIESHAMLLSFFSEINYDKNFITDAKIWLLNNKRTNHWRSGSATATAIYALLIDGESEGITPWIMEEGSADIWLDDKKLEITKDKLETATGYFKKSWGQASLDENLNSVKIYNPNEQVSWGGTYYQYFEDIDKVKSHEDNPLQVKKQLFKEISTDYGSQLIELDDKAKLAPGDRIISRIEIRSDRSMNYLHLKDLRPSGLEPENTISQYKWKSGFGYYESTRDLASHFYIGHLAKGTYVFEYPLRVVHEGDYSVGMASIQSMYAPEFISHSEGGRMTVE